ncbi:MAG TPA: glycosyltransferase family 39 protein [Myxococcota bacterium]|nr:glycosyltransferase family 39 protein [Myxococcota bacterium]
MPTLSRVQIAALLAAAALWLYAPVRALPYLRFDDEQYVTQNRAVAAGLTPDGVAWAFTTFHASNWHPLTWLSHMLDVSVFGGSAAGPHVENALLHALCTVLVFLFLARLTGANGRSAAAALLWAMHPQHVESVAWISERKDLLCAAFGLLALLSWTRFAREGGRGAYAAALGFAALGLLAKPMLVSLPLLFFALDLWPLARPLSRRTIAEKLPFVALSLASSLVTMRAQVHAMQLEVSLEGRLENAVLAVCETLGHGFLPMGLAAMYPHPVPGLHLMLRFSTLVGAGVALASLPLALLRRPRYVTAAWLWFGFALAPTVGLVQVGFQSSADRYAYLPQIGVAWAVAWGAADLLARLRAPSAVGPALAGATALALALVTRAQLGYWQNDVVLWQRAVEVAPEGFYAQTELAIELLNVGRNAEALDHFETALALNPRWARAHANYAFALFLGNDTAGANEHFARAFELEPHPTAAMEWHIYYAHALADAGRADEAVAHYGAQLEMDPNDHWALLGLAELRATQPEPLRDPAEAFRLATQACTAVRCETPGELDVLALAFAAAGDTENAVKVEQEALRRAQAVGALGLAARISRHLELFSKGQAVTGSPT